MLKRRQTKRTWRHPETRRSVSAYPTSARNGPAERSLHRTCLGRMLRILRRRAAGRGGEGKSYLSSANCLYMHILIHPYTCSYGIHSYVCLRHIQLHPRPSPVLIQGFVRCVNGLRVSSNGMLASGATELTFGLSGLL